jgi:hypothetical protein
MRVLSVANTNLSAAQVTEKEYASNLLCGKLLRDVTFLDITVQLSDLNLLLRNWD